jgi:hypothetical protein
VAGALGGDEHVLQHREAHEQPGSGESTPRDMKSPGQPRARGDHGLSALCTTPCRERASPRGFVEGVAGALGVVEGAAPAW